MHENIEKSFLRPQGLNDKIIIVISILAALIFSISSYHFSPLFLPFLVLGAVAAIFISRYPEILIVAAFSSGIFKEWLAEHVSLFASVDFTVAIFALSFLIIAYNVLLRGDLFRTPFDKSFVPLVLFTVFMLISTLYTPSPKYGVFKTFSFLVFNWGIFIMPLLALREESQVRRMTLTLIGVATAVAMYSLILLVKGVVSGDIIYSYRASFLGVNPISFANWVGVIDVLLIAHFPMLKHLRQKIAAAAAVTIMTVALLAANSRGPMLSFALTSAWVFVARFRYMKSRHVVFMVIIGLCLLVALFFVLPEQVTSRYVDLFGGGSDVVSRTASKYTINTRLFAWKAAIGTAFSNVKNLLFGIGVGGFSNIFYGLDVRLYPHNMIFETLCELGLIGLLLLGWHFKLIFFRAHKAIKSLAGPQQLTVFAYFIGGIFLLISAEFSGDLNDNRRLWFFLGACLAIVHLYQSKKKSILHD